MNTVFNYTEALFRSIDALMSRPETNSHSSALNPEHTESTFTQLALELFNYQFERNFAYQAFCKRSGKTPASVSRWQEIPAVSTVGFKEVPLTTLSDQERSHCFKSSGTGNGLRSKHYHDCESLHLHSKSVLFWFMKHLLNAFDNGINEEGDKTTTRPVILSLTPSLMDSSESSLVYMIDQVMQRLGDPESVYLGKTDSNGDWAINFELLQTTLQKKISGHTKPILMIGTAFNFVHLLENWTSRGIRVQLPRFSRIMETGGYKGRSRAIEKQELLQWIENRIGVRELDIISEYGMSELSSQGYNGIAGMQKSRSSRNQDYFQFPHWTRVQIISPETGLECVRGETGLIRILDLANIKSVSMIETQDLGEIGDNGLILHGRRSEAEPKGCSLQSSE
ncbi:MAG TPA: hypothetical protein EYQ50_00050 [Verrucomicrobiales bacterium]|nr:hypothetical protein [Verrucomicrobiales bacterium]HIL69408.1 hypothetical protein [Verrucomicrobiota bacterium]